MSDIGRERRLRCGDDAYNTIRMETLKEDIGDSVRPKDTFESQGGSMKDSCKTSNDVRC